MKISKQFPLFLLFFALCLPGTAATNQCSNLFLKSSQKIYFKPYLGRPNISDKEWKRFVKEKGLEDLELQEHQFNKYFLGEGRGGGSVYRIESTNGSFNDFSLKIYKNQNSRTNDILAFIYLKNVKKEINLPLNIPAFTIIGRSALKIEFIAGRTVEDIVSSQFDYFDIRSRVLFDFNSKNQTLYNYLKAQLPSDKIKYLTLLTNDNPFLLFMIKKPNENKYIDFWLKPDNIIVDSKTLELWIIDPN